MPRYAHQTGHYVSRRFGWDCHGLPIEHEIDKLHKINSKEDVLKMGIDTYNKECRSIVMRFSKEWEVTVKRCGRWIDFENDYKTMNTSFRKELSGGARIMNSTTWTISSSDVKVVRNPRSSLSQ